MDTQELQAIRERAEAATPGPWKHKKTYISTITTEPESDDFIVWGDGGVDKETDAEFIAHARTDIPALLDALAAVTAERDALRVKVDAVPVASIRAMYAGLKPAYYRRAYADVADWFTTA